MDMEVSNQGLGGLSPLEACIDIEEKIFGHEVFCLEGIPEEFATENLGPPTVIGSYCYLEDGDPDPADLALPALRPKRTLVSVRNFWESQEDALEIARHLRMDVSGGGGDSTAGWTVRMPGAPENVDFYRSSLSEAIVACACSEMMGILGPVRD